MYQKFLETSSSRKFKRAISFVLNKKSNLLNRMSVYLTTAAQKVKTYREMARKGFLNAARKNTKSVKEIQQCSD